MSAANTTTEISPMRWTRATQGRTWLPRPAARHDETRRTTLTSRAVPGCDTTRKSPSRMMSVP